MSGPEPVDVVRLAQQLPAFGALGRVVRRVVRRRFTSQRLPDAQVEVLRTVEANPGIGTGAVAERLQLVPNTVSTIVGELVAAGLLTRARDAGDRRVARLHLTEAAVERLARWAAARDEVLSAALRRLDEADRQAIEQALPAVRRLLTVLDQVEEPEDAGPRGTTTGQPVAGSRSTPESMP
jgi:DNA-binding MarR family transcriptional regulator